MEDIIKQQCENRLKGFCKFYRSDIRLLTASIDDREYILHCVIKYIAADWDNRHPLYGHFTYDPEVFSFYTRWKISKVEKVFKRLREKGFVTCVNKRTKLYKHTHFGSSKIAVLDEKSTNLENARPVRVDSTADHETKFSNNIVSYKKYSSIGTGGNVIGSELGNLGLSEEDARWIDGNIKEMPL